MLCIQLARHCSPCSFVLASLASLSLAPPSDSSTPLTVKYGVGNTGKSATSAVHTYKIEGSKYKYNSPNLHTALLCNLTPGASYTYAIEGFTGTFKSIPAATKKTLLSVDGDADTVIFAGDWSYASGCHEDWDKWLQETQPLFSKVPLLGITGNHEVKFEDLYFQYGVDDVMSVFNNKITEGAPTYFTVGMGSHSLYQGAIKPIPKWSKSMSSSLYGHARVIADDDKLTIHFRANGETTTMFDSVEIKRQARVLSRKDRYPWESRVALADYEFIDVLLL
ncbi:hypothetical protein SDRG_04413 [Saprolegnia diclina VS20]|uniref:Purple acid phosphatase n=1 Tax=Saprolegnia diclina (strain VS20) TaxID=1156394 RepID=T0RZQ1_SAPDV|nr:hypothetical protein SDRG_04413 [Saprolegnia diclina VS20]EQC37983.1 hypothetical protein SDRG_04413 [Saprolegnia diclina VS20]|eukprot:XP_008608310.1 hypothetical protein SDRG_04413 [Saprolegnia diclina VS20]